MSTRIYVCGHRPFTPPPDPAYQALHVGKNGGPSLGFPGDDTGDNISWKNYRYGELTGMWWIWKNSDFNGNVGLCHYRRYFINPEQYPFTEAEFDQILSSYDCITPQVMEVDPAFASYRDYYNDAHDPAQLPLLCQAMQEVDPEGLPVLEETLSERLFYYGNLCVFHRSEFDAYVAWLFALLGWVEERLDVSGYDEYHGRVYGFLSEQLLRTWTKRRNLSVYECPVGLASEKAETTELKLAMKKLVKLHQIEEAITMFREVLRIRPDIAQASSDLAGEVPTIEKVLYIIREEQKRNIPGLLAFSDDLPVLLDHYRKTVESLRSGGPASSGPGSGVSQVMEQIIRGVEEI